MILTNSDSAARWMDAMRRGDFEAAWSISDALLATKSQEDHHKLPRHLQSIWNGQPVSRKRVLVRCYHGLGDTIHYIRYLPLLKREASDVIVWAQPSLIPLLRTVNGVDQLIELHDGAPDVEYDVDLEITELPYVFRTTLASIPADVPYVHLEPALLPKDKRLKVGLIWQSGDLTRLVRFLFTSFKDSRSCQASTGTSCNAIQ